MSKSEDQRLKVGLIGYGYVGRIFHIPFIKATPELALSAICSSRPDEVRAAHPDVQIFTEAAQICADPTLDIIVIASPNDSHREHAEMALRAGRHVVVDKPFTLTTADAIAVLKTARDVGRKVFVFQNRRWDSDFLAIKQIVSQGQLGVIRHFESAIDVFEPEISGNWRFGSGAGSGRWYDLAPHLVDQALLLFGAPSAISADLKCLRAEKGAVDWFLVTLHYDGLVVLLRGSMLSRKPTARFTLHGSEGSAVKKGQDPQEAQLNAGLSPPDAAFGLDSDPVTLTAVDSSEMQVRPPRGMQAQFYARLPAALHEMDSSFVTEAQMITVMRIIETANHASVARSTVPLELDPSHRRALDRDALYKAKLPMPL